ncbi:uncharacterized protein MELLADRAFT_87782 [Melampsora larici-populina 98AG31]|uniref:Uncharacterized protein n=1 Tax=Melampsora larici-populina (strain 98AG31 / pathotype 3-4-7) TaxID=747676 RepID=F4RPG1_MELLP|nr:uncharacterized protein MELLADRAFT_87782 [Melampsora larici-populina 98AG31]EGG05726.1 hypothetical protein MELLADRAFT_87782 [Melampsora larici-populina 98AG31]
MDQNTHVSVLGQKVHDNEMMMGMILTQMEYIRNKLKKSSGTMMAPKEGGDIIAGQHDSWYNDIESCKEAIEAIKQVRGMHTIRIDYGEQDCTRIQTLTSAIKGIEERLKGVDAKLDHLEEEEVKSNLLGLVQVPVCNELSTVDNSTKSVDLHMFNEKLATQEKAIIKQIFKHVENLLAAQANLMAGARDEDQKHMAGLVRKEINNLHQELLIQNASHDVTMMKNQVDPLASEIQELKTIVQTLRSTVETQRNTIELCSQKVELLEEAPQLSLLKDTGDDMDIEKPEDLLERRVSAVESSLFSVEAEAQREAVDAEKFVRFQENMLTLIKAMIEESSQIKSAEGVGDQSMITESEEPKLDLEEEFNSRFSALRKTIDDHVEKQIAITIERNAVQEKKSDVSEDLRLQIVDLKLRDEENRRQISDQAKAINNISAGLSHPDHAYSYTSQKPSEIEIRERESPHSEPSIDGRNDRQSVDILQGVSQSHLQVSGLIDQHTSNLQTASHLEGTTTSSSTNPIDQHSQSSFQGSVPVHNPANHPSFSQTSSNCDGATRSSLANPTFQDSQSSFPASVTMHNSENYPLTPRTNSHLEGETSHTRNNQPRKASVPRRSQKWRKSSITPQKPKDPTLRKERLLMSSQAKEADEQIASQVQKHFRLMAGVDRRKADFPRSPTREELDKLPKLTVDYETAPLGEAARNLIRPDHLQPTWKDEEMELTAKGMVTYCRRRLQQYGLPYVGLSTAQGDAQGEDWNRRVLAFCTDTFNKAYVGQEYHIVDHDPQRIMKLMQAHIQYRVKHMRKYNNQIDALQMVQKRDRQQQRCLRAGGLRA